MHVHSVVVVGPRAGSRAPGEPGRAVQALLDAGVIGPVHVLAPPDLSTAVRESLEGLPAILHASITELCGVLAGDEVGFATREAVPHTGERPEPTSGDGDRKPHFDDGASPAVLVHDAARPHVAPATVAALVEALRAGHSAAVPVLPLTDTVKRVDPHGVIGETPDRATLRVVQTPQAFRAPLLPAVLAVAVHDPTAAWTAVGAPVHTVAGHPGAFAVHTPWDARLAEAQR